MVTSSFRSFMKSSLVLGVCAFATAAVFAACGSSDKSEFDDGTGAANGSGANGSGGTRIGSGGSSAGGGVIDPDASCAQGSVAAGLSQVAMYIMLDRSGSMDDEMKWVNAVAGVKAFVDDPAAADLKVALGYFPVPTGQCNGGVYDQAVVPMGLLPGNAGAMKASVDGTLTNQMMGSGPGTGTPMEGALNGLRTFCRAYQTQNPTEKTVGLLITDGEPNGCNENNNALNAIGADMFGGTPSIPLYVMGMNGADLQFLNRLAASGGTMTAYNVSTGGNGAFLDALRQIRGDLLSCDFAMPAKKPNSTEDVNPNLVNINITVSGTQTGLGKVNSAADCVANAWYYNDNAAPTRIVLCPETCTAAQADPNTRIDVILGCTGQPPK